MPVRIRTPNLPAILMLAVLAACGEAASDAVGPNPQPTPPATTTVYTATFTLDSIVITPLEACDGRDLFNNAMPGAFHYRIVGKGHGNEGVMESSGYGSVLGAAVSRGPKGVISLGARKLTFGGINEDELVNLTLAMIEWDGPFVDGVLKGQVESVKENPSARGINFRNSNHVSVGNGATCGGRLYYQFQVTGKAN